MTTETAPAIKLQRVVILGANGAMGAGAAAMFAGGGCEVTLVARDLGKVEGAMAQVQGIAKSEKIIDAMTAMTYADGMENVLAGADLIFEAVAEDFDLKRSILAEVDAARPPDALVATVSSGLSIRAMADGLSEGFRRNFAGIHLFNPPHMMTGTELIPHPEMPAEKVQALKEILAERFGRSIILCKDMPAFAGNRVGFKVLNEVAQLAERHGVQKMDLLIGPYTGRAMAPLATIDLVGWDVHLAIVENVFATVQDEAIASFKAPDYLTRLAEHGHLGDKTPLLGGFYRRVVTDGKTTVEALDPATGKYAPIDRGMTIPFVEEIKDLHHRGRYRQGMARFMEAEGADADIARRVILGYISYAFHRAGAGEVVEQYADIDRIMTAGFNWAPPSGLVDLIGVDTVIKGLEQYNLPVPALLQAAQRGEVKTPLFNLPYVAVGRYFAG